MSIEQLQTGLKKIGISQQNEMQQKIERPIAEGEDYIVQSPTGSGKTLAYLLPLFEKYRDVQKENRVIILVPTHELAMQVHRQIEALSKASGISMQSAVMIGDANINRQIENLKEKPQFIVGTAGRIKELIQKRKIAAHLVKTIVLDEADKLLDDNNREMVQAVIKCTMRDRQLLLFSATMPEATLQKAKQLSTTAQVLRIENKETIPKHITHQYLVVERRDKLDTLRGLAGVLKPKKAMVFINKVSEIEEATEKLTYHHYPAACIHGSNKKEERKKAVEDFEKGTIHYLIATDIAARGLHFPQIDMVFHISIPENPHDYLHRAGRTGRNGNAGTNILIVTERELPLIRKLERVLGIQMKEYHLYHGELHSGRAHVHGAGKKTTGRRQEPKNAVQQGKKAVK